MEIAANGFIFSDDPARIDIAAVHHYLSTQSYWARDIPFETVMRAINGSLCFGIYQDSKQIGFARWITDKTTFAYLADVYTEEEYRGKGLMKQLMSLMLFHPDLQNLRRYQLSTHDAHGLYSQFGFKPLEAPDNQMAIAIPNPYQKREDN
ncbi:GNAT family N-acetyltransferase [Pedobacter antarcticus]|uniref:GNAT family N-acetyltransferase n=1 Tax=Pedobacter antarcticus TaxID=34086 RepID=UPI00292F5E2E|nr:GNAT family N-acetyltransferase [Pedobacter antarcticus]